MRKPTVVEHGVDYPDLRAPLCSLANIGAATGTHVLVISRYESLRRERPHRRRDNCPLDGRQRSPALHANGTTNQAVVFIALLCFGWLWGICDRLPGAPPDAKVIGDRVDSL